MAYEKYPICVKCRAITCPGSFGQACMYSNQFDTPRNQENKCCEKCLKCPDYSSHNFCHNKYCPCHQEEPSKDLETELFEQAKDTGFSNFPPQPQPEPKKIEIVPSSRIDWCGECQMEHLYGCPPTPQPQDWEEDEIIFLCNAVLTKTESTRLKLFIRQLLSSEKEKAYEEGGRIESYQNGYMDGAKAERQKVVEMVKAIKIPVGISWELELLQFKIELLQSLTNAPKK